MSEQIKLSIVSRQAAPSGTEYDSIVEDHMGTIALRNGVLFVRWETDGVKTLMKITDGTRIDIIRSGDLESHLTFEKGRLDRSSYQSAAGVMELATDTHELTIEGELKNPNLYDPKICIHLSYDLIVSGERVSENDMLMRISSPDRPQLR